MALTPQQQRISMLANLAEKTGKPLPAWLALIAAKTFDKHAQIVRFLKSEHGVTHGFANLIAREALSAGMADEALVDAQYAGARAGLRPILDAIVAAVATFGGDASIAPRKTSVSLRRNKQFALVQASTRTRIDVGLNLKGVEPWGRLEASGSFSAMVTHRVRLTSVEDVDGELIGWLRDAYEQA